MRQKRRRFYRVKDILLYFIYSENRNLKEEGVLQNEIFPRYMVPSAQTVNHILQEISILQYLFF